MLFTITTNTKLLAIRDFIVGTCWWSQTNSKAELGLGKEHMLNFELFSFYRKMCTVVSFSRFQNNCGGYSAFPPTVINSSFGFYVYDFFVKFINGLQLQETSQIKFGALFTGNRTVRLRIIQIIITSINSLIAYHNLTILSLSQFECVIVVNRIIKKYSLAIELTGEVQACIWPQTFLFPLRWIRWISKRKHIYSGLETRISLQDWNKWSY